MNALNLPFSLSKIFILGLVYFSTISLSHAQVELRDTVIHWQHHSFELYDDYSIKTNSTIDSDIQQITFSKAKVIENDYIRLVLLPEYGGRVLSFVYKPTNHEYLYQSECGSAYGIDDGNFYYNWLMVYGGIFPTFPEPEHGKTWLIPWDFSVLKQSEDTVTIRMEYQDSTAYSQAPGQFNNGITDITCQVEVSVYKNSTLWDYDIKLINNKPSDIKYEYWTCTTLSPGSEIGNTGSPLNSEIIIPVEKYFTGWSPGGWIGNFPSLDLSNINYLDEWKDMGIAYAEELNDIYWGVINHENEEGIFRISDNEETYGMKLWTWGRDNIDNNLYDYSNGGADNYIELWAGTSRSFFTDAVLEANEQKSWKESYFATVSLASIANMNNVAAVALDWQNSTQELTYSLNTFQTNKTYWAEVLIDGQLEPSIPNQQIDFNPLGHSEVISFEELNLISGDHLITLNLLNESGEVELNAAVNIEVEPVLSVFRPEIQKFDFEVYKESQNELRIVLPDNDRYTIQILDLNGKIISSVMSSTTEIIEMEQPGLYIIRVSNQAIMSSKKIIWQP